MNATHLRVDYLESPLGLGNTAPRFYWHCGGGERQTAYRIVCKRAGEEIWDSGFVESAEMTHIAYCGKPLRSRDIVNWSIQLRDETGAPGEIASSTFEMGLVDKADWQAKWITGDYRPAKNKRYPVDNFRRLFTADKPVEKARLYASAQGVYDVRINGTRLESHILAPGMTDYRRRIQHQAYDVTGLIAPENSIELRLADGWYRGSSAAYGVTNVYGTRTAVIAQLELTYCQDSGEDRACDGCDHLYSG